MTGKGWRTVHAGWIALAIASVPVDLAGQPAVPPPSGVASAAVIQARNVVVDRSPEGWFVTDFIQVRRSGEGIGLSELAGTGPTFLYPLPAAARGATVLTGGEGARGAFIAAGVLHASDPLPPGIHLFVARYRVEEPHFELPLPGVTETVDVLLREPVPPTEIEGLEPVGAARLDEGEPFLHFSGGGFTEGLLRIQAGADPATPSGATLALVLGFLLFGTGAFAWRSGGVPTGRDAASERADMIRSVAEIDEALEGPVALEGGTRQALEARRSELIRSLTTPPRGRAGRPATP